jgi:hypothetical protein
VLRDRCAGDGPIWGYAGVLSLGGVFFALGGWRVGCSAVAMRLSNLPTGFLGDWTTGTGAYRPLRRAAVVVPACCFGWLRVQRSRSGVFPSSSAVLHAAVLPRHGFGGSNRFTTDFKRSSVSHRRQTRLALCGRGVSLLRCSSRDRTSRLRVLLRSAMPNVMFRLQRSLQVFVWTLSA